MPEMFTAAIYDSANEPINRQMMARPTVVITEQFAICFRPEDQRPTADC